MEVVLAGVEDEFAEDALGAVEAFDPDGVTGFLPGERRAEIDGEGVGEAVDVRAAFPFIDFGDERVIDDQFFPGNAHTKGAEVMSDRINGIYKMKEEARKSWEAESSVEGRVSRAEKFYFRDAGGSERWRGKMPLPHAKTPPPGREIIFARARSKFPASARQARSSPAHSWA